MIAITVDIDWAPEEVIEDTISFFKESNIKCTFFCTHKSHILERADKNLFELSIHPNFNFLLEGKVGTAEKIIDDLLNIFPESIGIRSHSLMQSSVLLNLFAKKGMKYECNQFLPYARNVQPTVLWNGLLRLPFIWEDDTHWMYHKNFSSLDIDLDQGGLKIFNFHPIHIFLNTIDSNDYNKVKDHYQNPNELKIFRNQGPIKGVRDALILLIKTIQTNRLTTHKLSEIKPGFYD
jgi:hypothetical protein